jgi:tetratricopeptide (TPR) repeat protein
VDGDLYDALERIDAAIADREFDRAAELVGQAREAFDDDAELLVSEVEIAFDRGDWQDCIDLAEDYAERVEGSLRADLLAFQGYALFCSDRENRAREVFNEAVGADRRLWMALVGRATVHEHIGFPRAAELDLDRAIELDDQEAEPFAVRGAVHVQLGNLEEAERDYGYALEIDPYDEESRLELARLQAHGDRATEAMETLEPLVDDADDPDVAMRGALLRSQLAVSLGSHDVARDNARVARELGSDRPWGYLQLAAARLADGEPGEAIAALEEADGHIDDPGDVADLFALRATAYERLGKEGKAADHRDRIEGPARLPEVVYGPALNPAEHVPIHPDRPIDVQHILAEVFGDPDAAPPGYAEEVRELLDEIPELAKEYPAAGEVQIELPPIEEDGPSPGEIVLQLDRREGG